MVAEQCVHECKTSEFGGETMTYRHYVRSICMILAGWSVLIITGCAEIPHISSGPSSIRIKGSDTLLHLAEYWAFEYMKDNPGVSIYVEGGGSRLGIEALINGSVDIASTSRPLRSEEIRDIMNEHGSLGFSVLCAKDALSIYVHPTNTLYEVSLEQLRGIFTGSVSDWSLLGGHSSPIVVYARNPNSGTYAFLEEHILLGDDYLQDAVTLSTATEVMKAIAKDANGIGYAGFYHSGNIKGLRIDGVEPTPENVRNGTYPIARHLYFYLVKEPRGHVKKFIDWILSNEGQLIAQSIGYIPLYELPPNSN